jgi:hypothetical protein
MAEPRRSLPSSAGDVQLRRLGLGKANTGGPLRGQVVVAFVLVLIALGVPMYLMRQPSLSESEAPAASAQAKTKRKAGVTHSRIDAGAVKPRVKLGDVQRVKCSANIRQRGNEGPACDPLPAIEDQLKRAIVEQVDCAPKDARGSINFVLNIDFPTRQLNVFPGKSGDWKGPQAKRATQCVEKALARLKWDTVPHRYRFYTLAVMAQYTADTRALPTFE